MSKRGKDLFYLLEQREQDVRTEAPAAARKPAARKPGSAVANVRRWLGGSAAPGRRGREATTTPVGLIVTAVALVALGAGFALGRFLPRAEAAADLSAREGEGVAPRRPGPLDAVNEARGPAPGVLPAEKEEEILSNEWFQLLQFGAPHRAKAAAAAAFLRANGVDTARICRFQSEVTKRDLWVVLAYAPSRAAAADVLAKLQAVPVSRTWSPDQIAKLTAKDLQRFDPPRFDPAKK